MLKDYFSLEIDQVNVVNTCDLYKIIHNFPVNELSVCLLQEGRILTLPMLLPSYSPNLDRLPLFLVRLATEVHAVTVLCTPLPLTPIITQLNDFHPPSYYHNILVTVLHQTGELGLGERVFPDVC